MTVVEVICYPEMSGDCVPQKVSEIAFCTASDFMKIKTNTVFNISVVNTRACKICFRKQNVILEFLHLRLLMEQFNIINGQTLNKNLSDKLVQLKQIKSKKFAF